MQLMQPEPQSLENQGNKPTISSKLQTWSEIPASIADAICMFRSVGLFIATLYNAKH